ncbi:MAG: B12-binding domain-containing radical SAM protein [Nitrospinota bacterium]|nr:B12-binding domain-containing radical SAM protein [Nitrospinota bacterium]
MSIVPKVLLVYPPISKFERYGGRLGFFGGNQIPLGIFLLASYLREKGIEVHAIDAEARLMKPEDIAQLLKRDGYNVLGISATTVAFHRALELAKCAKEISPDVVTILGGPHVSTSPGQPMEYDAFDYAIRNEGEETLVELLGCLEVDGNHEEISGLSFRKGGEIKVNPARRYIEDLDTLPFPAYDMIPDIGIYSPPPFNYKKSPVVNIITSRGCPFKCTFCETTTFGRKVRMRSAKNIVDEIQHVTEKYGAREIAFVDDTFTVQPKRIYEIFELARERNLDFPWSCMSRVDTVDDALLEFMSQRGCWYVALGIESGDEEILKRIKKNIKFSQVEKVVSKCHELGMVTKGFFMIGHPGETVETIEKTIKYAQSILLDHVVVTINTPMPGSEQYRTVNSYGTLDESGWTKYNMWNPVFTPTGLSKKTMLSMQKKFIRSFYLQPRVILRNIRILLLKLFF